MPLAATDSTSLLQRIPELASLQHDPALQGPIDRNDLGALYAALLRARTREEHAVNRPLIDRLLGDRRLFLEPASPPTLSTINGVGTRLYGESERAPDGTHIATQYLTFVYVPVFPLSSYLVRKGDRNSWYFLGRVPFSGVQRLWRRAATGVAILAAIAAAGFGAFALQHHEVWFANGLPAAVQVQVGSSHLEVAPHSASPITLENGKHKVEVKLKGEVIDQGELEVIRGIDAQVWNIGGAAPVYSELTHYAESNAPPPSEHTSYCGQTLIHVADAQDFFHPSPDKTDVPKGGSATRRLVTLDEGEAEPVCAGELLEARKPDEAYRMARLFVLASTRDADLLWFSSVANAAGKSADARPLLAARAAAPNASVTAQRAFQTVRIQLDEGQAVLDEARKGWKKSLRDPVAAYLYARLVDRDEALAILEPLLKDPKLAQPDILQLAGEQEWSAHDAPAASAAFARLEAVDEAEWSEVLEEHMESLAAQGLFGDANTLLLKHAAKLTGDEFYSAARISAWLGDLGGGKEPYAVLRKQVRPDFIDDGAFDAWTFRDARDAKEPTTVPDEAWLHAAHWNPSQALDKPGLLVHTRFGDAPGPLLCLLSGEAHRTKNAAALAALQKERPELVESLAPLFTFIDTGDLPNDGPALSNGCFAAAAVVRLRMKGVAAKERALLRGAVAYFDPLVSYPGRALRDWPAP